MLHGVLNDMSTIKCPDCGRKISSRTVLTYCPHCGCPTSVAKSHARWQSIGGLVIIAVIIVGSYISSTENANQNDNPPQVVEQYNPVNNVTLNSNDDDSEFIESQEIDNEAETLIENVTTQSENESYTIVNDHYYDSIINYIPEQDNTTNYIFD